MNDRYGNKVKEGHQIESCYGIPPVKIIGTVIEMGGELWVMTPGHHPPKCKLTSFKGHVGEFEIINKVGKV